MVSSAKKRRKDGYNYAKEHYNDLTNNLQENEPIRLNLTHFSTHSLRKTFATRIYKMAGDKSEDALVRLSELLGHSSPAITRKYIGLTQKVMMDTYDMLS